LAITFCKVNVYLAHTFGFYHTYSFATLYYLYDPFVIELIFFFAKIWLLIFYPYFIASILYQILAWPIMTGNKMALHFKTKSNDRL
jgi:hypothetical protein